MDQAFRFLVMAGVTYMVFLCVIRIAIGSQYKSKSFLINIIGMISVYGSFIISRYNGVLKLPDILNYIIVMLLTIFLPPLALKMKSDQTLKYLAIGIVAIPLLHLLFSLLLGWGEYLPFIRIPSLWDLL
ncbi:MAG: hypothetical protein ACOYIG_00460 [Acetivibrionales bacterium]|jgi:hypothetical protein|nr:hypothetical protein [Clostridiaceae bacterium]